MYVLCSYSSETNTVAERRRPPPPEVAEGDNAPKRRKSVMQKINTPQKVLDNGTVGRAIAAKLVALQE